MRIVAGIEAAILYLCIIKNMLDIMLYKKKGNIMAKEKKLVEAITPMDKDFTQWYTDVVTKAELMHQIKRKNSWKESAILQDVGFRMSAVR